MFELFANFRNYQKGCYEFNNNHKFDSTISELFNVIDDWPVNLCQNKRNLLQCMEIVGRRISFMFDHSQRKCKMRQFSFIFHPKNNQSISITGFIEWKMPTNLFSESFMGYVYVSIEHYLIFGIWRWRKSDTFWSDRIRPKAGLSVGRSNDLIFTNQTSLRNT